MTDTAPTKGQPGPVIGIVGLGEPGRPLGLALQVVKTQYQIWGHDRDPARVKEAQRLGAIDRGHWNLINLAEGSDLIFLTEPVEETRQTLATIAPHVRPGTVLTDTAGTKVAVMRTAADVVPAGVSFVGGHPILGAGVGEEAKRFVGATYCLIPAPGAGDVAVRVLAELVTAIGAKPYFIDAQEHDALIAGVAQVSPLLETALLHVLTRSPSARDLERLGGSALSETRRRHELAAAEVRAALTENGAAVVHWLDQVMGELVSLREALAAGDEERAMAMLSAVDAALAEWGPVDERGVDRAAQAELEDYNPVRQAFFGRLGRRPKDPGA